MANNFKPIGGGGGGALDIPSDQVFSSNSERDAYFTANPEKLVEGAQCVVLTPLYLVHLYNRHHPRELSVYFVRNAVLR